MGGEPGPVRDAVLLNAGMALALAASGEGGPDPRTDEELAAAVRAGVERAARAIDSGAAARLVDDWVRATTEA